MDNQIVLQVAMKAVIVKDGKVLILREAATYGEGTQQGRYHLPGGRVESGEKFEDALSREVKEETNLEVNLGMPVYVGEWRPVIKGVKHQIIGMFMVCTPKGNQEIFLSTEHDKYEWVFPADLSKFDVMEPEGDVIGKAGEMIANNII
ncbi:MAG: NUDIX domain-containing protein [bacterium]|nr:NUDIX domain-containing protein [bacterium]